MSPWANGPRERPAAVAGTFYPADEFGIRTTLGSWRTDPVPPQRAWRAAMVPHAGWIFSGRLAASVLSQIDFPSTVVVLCPKHCPTGATRAVATWQQWAIPGGVMKADLELSAQLAESVPGLEPDNEPHRREHAVEVLLPMIAHQAPDTRLVAVTVGQTDLQQCGQIADSLARVVRDRLESLLFLVSSDMNHFASEPENRRLDELALAALERVDPDGLYQTCRQHGISMCGMLPAVIVLKTLQRLQAVHRAVRVGYTTSAEVSGDRRRVVGYAGMLFE